MVITHVWHVDSITVVNFVFLRELAPVTEPSTAPIMVEDVLDKVFRRFGGNGCHPQPVTLVYIDRNSFVPIYA